MGTRGARAGGVSMDGGPHIGRPRSASVLLGWMAVGALLWASPNGEAGVPSGGRGSVILTDPVSIMVAHAKDEGGWYSLELRVEHKQDRFQVMTRQGGDTLEAALTGQKADTHWQGRYLLIGYDRGGGNASRIALVTVFRLRNGRLLHLGEADPEMTKGGTFRDTYNKFERNDLTSHAGAPMFPVALEERENQLRANLERTWTENRASYRRTAHAIQEILRRAARTPQELDNELPELLLFNAVLAKYCNRSAELAHNLQAADATLAAEDLQQFREIIARVVPGELPAPAVRVVRAKP